MEENKEVRKELTNAELDKAAGGAIGGQFDGLDMDAVSYTHLYKGSEPDSCRKYSIRQ